jgi:4-amino-4-deoxy-L-arabinose transferase-like glycosyltransferase
LYARALEDGFHVDYFTASQRPHPPGYLLYVGTAAVARQFTNESNSALVLVSMIASALAAAALFLLARRFASDGAAAFATVGFVLSPLVWQYSEVAYPYTVLALLSVLLAACFAYARGRSVIHILIASAVFGVAAGFRQDLLLILGPLWAYAVWRLPWRARAAAAAMVWLGCMVWLVPTAVLSEGLPAYLDAVIHQTDFVRATHSVQAQGLPALGTNLAATLSATAWGLGLFTLPVVALCIARCYRAARERDIRVSERGALVIAWIVPGFVLYVGLHIGDSGYVLSILPGLFVVAAVAIDRVAVPQRARHLAFAAGALVPALVFVTSSAPVSAAAIVRHDSELALRVNYVREHYEADKTLLIAREDFLLVRYYLPEYRTWFHGRDPYRSSVQRKRAPRVDAIVVFTPGLQATSMDARRVTCAKDVELVYLAIEPGSIVELHDDSYTVAESPARR